ncbi:MAG: hypothetical protein MI725_09565 [Pirellulales bacterium]|nr:hypothetical protein [Pirellulales bacterium]
MLSKSREDQLVERISQQVVQELKVERAQKPKASISGQREQSSALSVLQQRCTKCHNQDNAKGQFNLDVKLSGLSRGARQKSLLRVLSTDPSRRMPKGQPPLSESEFLALFQEFVR